MMVFTCKVIFNSDFIGYPGPSVSFVQHPYSYQKRRNAGH